MLNGEGAENIKESESGFAVNAGDYKALAETILKASELPKEELEKLGQNARKFYEENFRMSECITNLENILNAKNP